MKIDIYKKLKVFKFSELIKSVHGKSNLSCLIFGNFGAMNLGDEAILAGEINELKNIKNIHITVVSRNPKYTSKLHGVESISIYSIYSIIKQIIKSDFIIIGGGGIICKADRGLIGLTYQLYMLFLYFASPKLLNKKVYVLGIGIYTNSNLLVLKAATIFLKSAEIITVRDFHSYDYLKSKNIKSKLYKDNSYLMELSSNKDVGKDTFFAKHIQKNKRNIGISILKPKNKSEENFLKSEIKKFVKNNFKDSIFWFYSCDFQKGFYNDYLFSKEIIRYLKSDLGDEFTSYLIPTSWGPQKFFSSFKFMDMFFTTRLHSSIFAHRMGINFKAYSYDQKCSSFLNAIGKDYIDIQNSKSQQSPKFINRVKFAAFVYFRRFIYIIVGFADLFKLEKPNVFVISYHSVNDDNWRFSIDSKVIRKQLTYLYDNFDVISLKRLEEYVRGKTQIRKPSVVITFDDGYRDVLKLKDFFIKRVAKPAILVLSNPKKANRYELESKNTLLNHEEINSLYLEGWEVGCHSATHSDFSALNDAELKYEIITSKKMLEKSLRFQVRYFAYPKGKYSNKILEYVKSAGYKLGLTMDDNTVLKSTNPFLIPRIGVDRTHSFLEFKSLLKPSTLKIKYFVKSSYAGRFV